MPYARERHFSLSITSTRGGVITPKSFMFNISMGKNAPASWNIQIADPTGSLAGDLMDPIAGHTLSMAITGDATFTSPTLYPVTREWNADSETGYHLSLNGGDASSLLMVRGKTMASQISTLGDIKMARTLVGGVCTANGVTPSLTFYDFPVRNWSFQSASPMEKIKELVDIVLGEWCFLSGNTMTIYDHRGGPVSAVAYGPSTLMKVTETVEKIQVVNRMQVIRTRVVKNYGEQEVTAPGRYEIPFSTPIYYPHYTTYDEFNGAWYRGSGADAMTFEHADGSWDYTGAGATPYVKAWASFLVDPATPRHGRIEFDGISAAEAAVIPGFDQVYDVTENDYASQGLFGVLPNDTVITNVLIPTSTVATLHARRAMAEANRLARRASFRPRFYGNILLPMTQITLSEPVGGVTGNWYVENLNLACSPTGFSNTFSAVQYSIPRYTP